MASSHGWSSRPSASLLTAVRSPRRRGPPSPPRNVKESRTAASKCLVSRSTAPSPNSWPEWSGLKSRRLFSRRRLPPIWQRFGNRFAGLLPEIRSASSLPVGFFVPVRCSAPRCGIALLFLKESEGRSLGRHREPLKRGVDKGVENGNPGKKVAEVTVGSVTIPILYSPKPVRGRSLAQNPCARRARAGAGSRTGLLRGGSFRAMTA